MVFWYDEIDKDRHEINPLPWEVEARDLGHAMQKIAARLSDECVEVHVWRGALAEKEG